MKPLFISMTAVLFGSCSMMATAQTTDEELLELIRQQQAQIEALQEVLEAQEKQISENTIIATTAVEAIESTTSTAASGRWYDRVSIGGYAEHHLNLLDDATDIIDAHRYVLFINNEFTDRLRFISELELEHSIAGEGQPGEIELEQAFIQFQYAASHRVNIGQHLIPVGILNETHEPDTFYGVERNRVETEVIPSTWWETGLQFQGEISPGLTYDLGVHSGLFVENFRIRSGRQRSALATADDFAYTGRLKYTGVPGLEVAATLNYQTDITQSTFDESAAAILYAAHVIYNSGDFGLRALYSGWQIDNDEFEANGSDSPQGWYIEPSYKVTNELGVFARYSEVDPARGDRPTQLTNQVDLGFNYWLHPQVVLKADYQNNLEDGADGFNLGVGWSF